MPGERSILEELLKRKGRKAPSNNIGIHKSFSSSFNSSKTSKTSK